MLIILRERRPSEKKARALKKKADTFLYHMGVSRNGVWGSLCSFSLSFLLVGIHT